METGQNLNLGDIVEAEITRVADFGAFAKINGHTLGLIHISQIADTFVKDVNQHLKVGDKVKVKVVKLGPGKKVDLSLRFKEGESGSKPPEDKFKQNSQSKHSPGPFMHRNGRGRGFSAGSGERRSGQSAADYSGRAGFKSSDFEDKLKRFLKVSQQGITDLKKRTDRYHR